MLALISVSFTSNTTSEFYGNWQVSEEGLDCVIWSHYFISSHCFSIFLIVNENQKDWKSVRWSEMKMSSDHVIEPISV